ncbi:MAG: hypothetical protein ACQGVK_13930 [Myxococcota bacterium]
MSRSVPGLEPRWLDWLGVGLVAGVYCLLLPEAPHLDGIRWTDAIAEHRLQVNPNYLLMQPIVMGLHAAWETLAGPSDSILFAKRVDVACGALSLGLMAATLRVLGVGAAVRWSCLLLTAFSYNFLHLSTSDHIKLVTAPFLFAALHFLVLQARDPSRAWATGAGVSMALAVCTLINAVVWGVLLVPVMWILSGPDPGRRLRDTAIFCASAGLPALGLVLAFYAASAGDAPIWEWLTSYSANPETRGDGFEGVSLLTLGRFVFAFLKNFVYAPDVSAAVKALLSGSPLPPASDWSVLNALATLTTGLGLTWLVGAIAVAWVRGGLGDGDRRVMWVLASMILGFALFGFAWNDSDEEFWFQLTAPIALAAALAVDRGVASRGAAGVLHGVTFVLVLNQLVSFALPRAAEPYEENLAELQTSLSGCGWILYDEADGRGELLMGLRHRTGIEPESIMFMARRHGFELDEIVAEIDATVERTRAAGGRVCVVGLFEASDYEYPWTNLAERFGISRETFVQRLAARGAFERREVAGQPLYVLEPPSSAAP